MFVSFGIPHTNERNHFCHTEYPGNYVAHFLAVKQAHPNITLVANCDLSNLDNEVSFPHKVCAPQRCGQTCAAIALSGLGSRPGSAQRSAAPRRWVACAAHRAAHSIARTRALSCAVSLHGPSLTHANTPSHRQVGHTSFQMYPGHNFPPMPLPYPAPLPREQVELWDFHTYPSADWFVQQANLEVRAVPPPCGVERWTPSRLHQRHGLPMAVER
jgi:hypothetical protein